jgi:DNA-binding winged helix-turn-helix (wHTH) protein/CheY-like chemotaxis protein
MPEQVAPTPPLPNEFLLGPWRVIRDRNRLEHTSDNAKPFQSLEPKAMDVLCTLAAHAGQTVTRDALLDTVWHGRPVVEGVLSRVIAALRTVLDDDARQPRFIETVSKRGYRLLVAPALETPSASLAPPSIPLLVPRRVVQRRPWAIAALVAVALVTVSWFAYPYVQLERATTSGTQAILNRGAQTVDRDQLRQELSLMRVGRILWVDDNPSGNALEIQTFDQLGLLVDAVRSNAAAAERLRGREYDLIISDIRRAAPERQLAGLDLPREIIPDRNRVPPIIYYTRAVAAERTHDGYPVTNKADQLFSLASDILRWRQGGMTRPFDVESADLLARQ